MKKIKLALFFSFASMIVLQLFFGRDFTQLKDAFKKYHQKGVLSQLGEDIATIFAGKNINLGGIATADLKERLIYIWTDTKGGVHHSETKPKVGEYKVIKMGDGLIKSQKGLTDEEIEQQLNSKP